VPDSLNLRNVTLIVEGHLAIAVKLVSLDLALVTDSRIRPLYLKVTVHLLIIESALVDDWALFIPACVPFAVDK